MDNSPFNKLSAELRNEIYALALVRPRILVAHLGKLSSAPKQPAITQTCRQIRHESFFMFYALNNFHVCVQLMRTNLIRRRRRTVELLKQTEQWLEAIGGKRRDAIRKLIIDVLIDDRINSVFDVREWHWDGEDHVWRQFARTFKGQDFAGSRAKLLLHVSPQCTDPGWEERERFHRRQLELLEFPGEVAVWLEEKAAPAGEASEEGEETSFY